MRRPHFRHQDGSHRDDCLILAARAAALRQLQDDGWLQLPRRRMSGKVAGLSGNFHEAWVELPPVRKRISASARSGIGKRMFRATLNKPEISTLRRADARLG